VIIDPAGTVPVFLALTRGRSDRDRNRLAWQATIVAFGVIVVFALFGRTILDYLGVGPAALEGAGGLLLLLVALELLVVGRSTGAERKDALGMTARIELVPSSTDRTNTWIIGDREEVIVIDPGRDPAAVLDAVGDREVLAVICTHGHEDHIEAAVEVAERDEAPVALHPKDRPLWREVHADDAEIEMADGGIFEVADVTLEVIHAPGHTDGSVCLYCEQLGAVFTGHVLLAGGPVPHEDEFPDFADQVNAIGENLLTLPSATRVLPGQGEETTIGAAEKNFDSWVTAGPD
jgi:glyoxylase-like metal-dependent hydrolase (beta-lactamase superfamily II)